MEGERKRNHLILGGVIALGATLAVVQGVEVSRRLDGADAPEGVPDDRTCRLLLLQSAWRMPAGGRDFSLRLDVTGQLDIVAWDDEAGEEVAGRGSWRVEKGELHLDVHYTDDESWIRTGSFGFRIEALGDRGGSWVLRYTRLAGNGGPAGAPASGQLLTTSE